MPPSVLGTVLALVALAVTIAIIYAVTRRPFVGLGALVAGMAFHSIVLMVLLKLQTPNVLVRAVQSWKEVVLLTLVVVAALELIRAHRAGTRWRFITMDWIALAFAGVLTLYLFLPSGLLHGDSTILQRLVAYRFAILIPLLYFLGRVFATPRDRDLAVTGWVIVGAGAVVGAFGTYELWFVPTVRWLDWGVNLYTSYLGFKYSGPAGLPENFFQSLPDGMLLRRMVSTYISPLGAAYTGLLVVPIAYALIDRRDQRRALTVAATVLGALMLAGLLFAVTRLALLALVGEVFLIGLAMRTRAAWIVPPIVVACVAVMLFGYPQVGPVVDPYLLPGESHRHQILYIGDPSFTEHMRYLIQDSKTVMQHPLGVGLGGSIHRFAETAHDTAGTGESAVFGLFGDTGFVGGLLYCALFVLSLVYGWRSLLRAPRRTLLVALPLVAAVGGLALIPITLTSDVWGDLSVTFLYWWAAGYVATAAQQRAMAVSDEHKATPRQAA